MQSVYLLSKYSVSITLFVEQVTRLSSNLMHCSCVLIWFVVFVTSLFLAYTVVLAIGTILLSVCLSVCPWCLCAIDDRSLTLSVTSVTSVAPCYNSIAMYWTILKPVLLWRFNYESELCAICICILFHLTSFIRKKLVKMVTMMCSGSVILDQACNFLNRVGHKLHQCFIAYCQPFLKYLAFGRKFATARCIVRPPNTVCVTTLPCKMLIMTMFQKIHC